MTSRPARELYLEANQTHPEPITPYERKLAGSLREVFTGGAETLDQVIDGLNGLGLHGPGGGPWTAADFRAEMRRLGK